MYPQDLEIDGTRDSEGESVIVRDRVSAWVYILGVYQRQQSLICIHYRPTAVAHTQNQAHHHHNNHYHHQHHVPRELLLLLSPRKWRHSDSSVDEQA